MKRSPSLWTKVYGTAFFSIPFIQRRNLNNRDRFVILLREALAPPRDVIPVCSTSSESARHDSPPLARRPLGGRPRLRCHDGPCRHALYVGVGTNDSIITYSTTATTPTPTTFASASSGLEGPTGLAIDSAGNVYVANLITNTIEKFTPGGVGSLFASTGLNSPVGMAFDSAGNLYVANSGTVGQFSTTIEEFTPSGVGSLFATIPNNQQPSVLTFAPATVPEPSGLVLGGLALVSLGLFACARQWLWLQKPEPRF